MLKAILTTVSLASGILMYIPLYKKMLRRKQTGDFSKTTQCMVLGTQVLNGTIAALDSAWYNAGIYLLHIVLVAGATFLVFKYHDN